MTLPPHVEDGVGLPVFRGPYMQEDAELGVLLLQADQQQLQALCDHYLNGPAEGSVRYKALLPYVMLVMSNMTIYSLDDVDKNIGRMQEADLSFWVLTAVQTYRNGRYVTDHLAWYLPYVFVNNPYAVATGREVFGFPKIYSQFDLPQSMRNPEFSVNTLAFSRFGPNEQGTQQWLMSVRQASDNGHQANTQPWKNAGEAIKDILKLLAGNEQGLLAEAEAAINLFRHFSLNVPMVFLKQFRDVQDTTRAAYQAVIEAPARPTKFKGGWPLSTAYDVHINDLASFPLAEQLGLKLTNGMIRSSAGFWINMDFVMELGRVVAPPQQQPVPPVKRKIAVLGGGVGAMAAAFALTSEPDWQDRYDVSVYQLGWRLGGKGASGRQQNDGDRILEHGLHIWFGFYANAFHVMNACYEELGRPPGAPLATIADAFKPQNVVGVVDEWRNQWWPWVFNFPADSDTPWNGPVEHAPIDYVKKLIEWAYEMFKEFRSESAALPTAEAPAPAPESIAADVASVIKRVASAAMAGLLQGGDDTNGDQQPHAHAFHLIAASALAETMHHLSKHVEPATPAAPPSNGLDVEVPVHHHFLAAIIGKLRDELKHYEQRLESLPEKLRELWILLDLALVNGYGMLMSGVLTHGFNIIDGVEYRQWLIDYGASKTVAYSAPVRAYYDLAFAYPKGNVGPDEPSTAGNTSAGTTLHAIMLILFAYKGAVMWKMQAGMGDVVFGPFYEVLKKRGVNFHFFHKITTLQPSSDGTHIDQIRYNKQVTLKNTAYEPLIDVDGLPSWPSEPLYDQITQGAELQEQQINLESAWTPWVDVEQDLVLQRGVDFDDVVLGISLGALKEICAPLVAINGQWSAMVNNVQTVQTQAMQLWFTKNLAELGWQKASAIVDAYAQPFNTWADMSQVLAAENWPSGKQPGNVSYFCGPLQDAAVIPPYSDHAFPETQLARVKEAASAWVKANLGLLMPNVVDAEGNVNWSLFYDSTDQDGEARFWSQFFRANIDPTERYVLSVAGTSQYRLRGDQSGFTNLVLAGDWTDNGFLNVGAVEPAVISGLQAAKAISGASLAVLGENSIGSQPIATSIPNSVEP